MDQPLKRQKVAPAGEGTKENKVMAEEPPSKENARTAKEGFKVQCQDGDDVVVSSDEAEILMEKCDYFKKAFRFGTKEIEQRTLVKPDWTKDTADAIVDLITRGNCGIPHDYKQLKAAADQIQIPLRVAHPIGGNDISNDEETVQSLFKRWTTRKSQFVLETPLLSEPSRWKDLFGSGVVLIRDENDLVVELGGSGADNHNAPSESNIFHVAAATPLCVTVFHTCMYLSRSTSIAEKNGNITKRSFSIMFKANLGSGLYLKHALGKNVSSRDLGLQEMVSYSGTVEELSAALEFVADFIIPQENVKLCFLQLISPNSWTLGRLIRASQRCVDNPATLGWDATRNCFVALKTVQDIGMMLQNLQDSSLKAAAEGPFHLKDHSLLCDCWKAF